MNKSLQTLLCFIATIGMSAAGIASGHGRDCLRSLRSAFAKSGYAPDIDCSGTKFVIKTEFLGEIRFGGKRYRVYQTRFHFNPIPTNTHWGERLFVFDGRGRYLGEYAMAGFYNRFRIVGHALVSDLPVSDNKITFTAKGPPETASLDGEPVGFYR